MKIVLIAGFSNPEIREHLKFRNDSRLYKLLIKTFGLPARVGEFRDYGPWVPNIIAEVEKHGDIELHVVGHQIRLKQSMQTFQMRGVTYHFFPSEWTSFMRKCGKYSLWKKLQRSTHYVRQVVEEVKPDLIVLSGAENPATSIGILASDKYLRLCLCQTIYNNPERSQYSNPDSLKLEMEMDIFSQLKYFGVYSSMHYKLLREFRPNATIFKFGYPSKGRLLEPSEVKKEYAHVVFDHVNLSCDQKGMEQLKSLVAELDLEANVSFTPFFEKRSDLLLHVQKSHFAVLPCKLDHTSGTMTQSMQLGLPIVVYKTTGTPSFNREKQCALIAEKENVEQLAQHMMALMDNPELAETLRKNAREFQEKKAEIAKQNGKRLIETFKAVIEHYKEGKEIPQNLLFNPERDN